MAQPEQQQVPVIDIVRMAMEEHRKGNYPLARYYYDTVLSAVPDMPDAAHFGGYLYVQIGEQERGLKLLKHSIALRPDFAPFYCNYANILKDIGRFEDAKQYYLDALKLQSIYPEAHNNLAVLMQLLGEVNNAERHFLLALSQREGYADAALNLAGLYAIKGNRGQAKKYYEIAASYGVNDSEKILAEANAAILAQDHELANKKLLEAVSLTPDHPGIHLLLAKTYFFQRMMPACELHAKRARTILQSQRFNPIYIDSCTVLSAALSDRGENEEAIAVAAEATELAPQYGSAYINLGMAQMRASRLQDAERNLLKAVELSPEEAAAHNNLGLVYKEFGNLEAAKREFLEAARLSPEHAGMYQNYLLVSVYDASSNISQIFAEHKEFDERYAKKFLPSSLVYSNSLDANRKLKIGFVSPDVRDHAVYFFLGTLLEHYPRTDIDITIYYSGTVIDRCSNEAKSFVDNWVNCVHLSDDELAGLIKEDQIDILIDPAGHTAHNRLMVFARKPAPVQMTWLGHPNTTGMKAIDYRITDAFAEPPGTAEHLNVEKLLYLPEVFCAFRPWKTPKPTVVNNPPMEENGFFTFGCFNNFAKITPDVVALWARILKRNKSAKLMLEAKGFEGAAFRQQVLDDFRRHDVSAEQLILIPRSPENQYVLYNKVDVALDPFPLNGGTTTFDALWMGCPVVTLSGDHFRSRMGVTIVSNAGLSELVASSEDEYFEIATKLVDDREYLKRVRKGLHERVEKSPLMDGPRFARHFTDAMRKVWIDWCAEHTVKGEQA